MRKPHRINLTVIGLYTVAALLLANLVATFTRSDTDVLPAAFAQRQAPIAGGAGLFIMPAQLQHNVWGCYLMDVDRGVMCVYQFLPGSKQLQFIASRNFKNDTQLLNFNTTPSPQEILDLVNKQNQAVRAGHSILPVPEEAPKKD